MEGGFFFQDASSSLLAVRTRMPLHKIDLFHEDLFFLWKDSEDPATFAPFPSLDHHDQVILLDMNLGTIIFVSPFHP